MKWLRVLRVVIAVAFIAAVAGCKNGEIRQSARKDFNLMTNDLTTQLNGWLEETRAGFSDESCHIDLREYQSRFKVVHTDGRTFFSYRAKCFIDNGRWLHGGEIVKVGTIDVKTGRRLTTADVIPKSKRAEALARVRAAVIAKIGEEINLMPSATEVLARLSENFYVGEDGLHFIFAEYSVAPYHYAPELYGPVEVVIPAYGKYKKK